MCEYQNTLPNHALDPKHSRADIPLLVTSALPQLWSCVEVSFGVISTCIPSLTPLVLMLFGKRSTTPYSSRRKERIRRTRTTDLDDVADLEDNQSGTQSLELIMQRCQRNTEMNVSGVSRQADQGILVTHEIDQTSNSSLHQGCTRNNLSFETDVTTTAR